MQAVKVLPKGQITLPKKIRRMFQVREGDTLLIEGTHQGIILKKGKTIFDYKAALPSLGMSIRDMREKAVEEAAKDHG